jgi:hypothetical protein
MLALRKKSSRTRTRAAKEETDPLPTDDPASCPLRIDYHHVFATYPGVIEELFTTLQAYLRELAVSDTLLVRLGTARSAQALGEYTEQLAANVQARTTQVATLQTLLSFLAHQRADSEEEPPVSIH